MTIPPSVSEQTYQYFVQEATELLQVMEEELQDIKQNFSLQKVYTLMRAAHTLKGASASVGLMSIQKATHSLEDIFKALCYDDTIVSETIEQLIFEGYECVRLLMSAQLVGTQVDSDETLNRMAKVISQLQAQLGDRVGEGGRLPSSSELGFDMTQSIFQMGVAQRLETLSTALDNPSPASLRSLLKTQAEVFVGLGESLGLPGFTAIAKMTYYAVEQYPDLILHIAPVALENFQSAQAAVLAGDRTQGGLPSIALQQFGGSAVQKELNEQLKNAVSPIQQSPSTQTAASDNKSQRRSGWFKRQWQMLTSPIGTPSTPTAAKANSKSAPLAAKRASTAADLISTKGVQTDSEQTDSEQIDSKQLNSEHSARENLDEINSKSHNSVPVLKPVASESDLSELTPSDLNGLNLQQPDSPISTKDKASVDAVVQKADLSSGLLSSDLVPSLEGLSPISAYSSSEEQLSKQSLSQSAIEQLKVSSKATSNVNLRVSSLDPKEIALPKHSETDREQGSPTIRISTDHLEKLDQAMGELLTEQNRQTLYNEQLTSLIKKLLNRIAAQQQQLNSQQTEYLIRRILPEAFSSEDALDLSASSSEEISMQMSRLSHRKNEYEENKYENFDSIELERYSDVQLLLQSCLEETIQQTESAEAIELFVKQSERALEKQKRLLANTRETLLEARMVPLETTLQQFPVVVERLKTYHQKLVDLTLLGSEILVDKAIIDQLYEPILHLVRNAFDHGIELPEERLEQNKSLTGNITIEGQQRGRHLIISVKDDGQGIDLESIKKAAIEKQLITSEQADLLTAQQTTDLLFRPGFSTAPTPDVLSGRGIGLDAVRAKVRSLQGWVDVSHDPASGTCFTLHIPTNLTIAKLLLCRAQGRTYALIADAVEHILIPTDKQLRTWKGGKVLAWQTEKEEHLVSVSVLNQVLRYASPMSAYQTSHSSTDYLSTNHSSNRAREGSHLKKQAPANPVILLRQQNTLVGLEVDQLLGEQELVISPLGKTIAPPAYLYGSSILPDGQLTLVLDGLRLARIMIDQRKESHLNAANGVPEGLSKAIAPPTNKPIFLKKLILTVDDSITVRNTLSEALQKANYQVIQARDGAEALQQLERYPDVQAILCDIEMPGMNGFEFLKVRQQTPAIAQIPTVILTSRMGKKHRLLTEELGATDYLTKPYLNPQLIKVVEKAIESATQTTEVQQTVEQPIT